MEFKEMVYDTEPKEHYQRCAGVALRFSRLFSLTYILLIPLNASVFVAPVLGQDVGSDQSQFVYFGKTTSPGESNRLSAAGGALVARSDEGKFEIWRFERDVATDRFASSPTAGNRTATHEILPGSPNELVTLSDRQDLNASAADRLSDKEAIFAPESVSVVQVPTFAYLRNVMPRGFVQRDNRTIVGTLSEPGELEVHVRQGFSLIVRPDSFEAASDREFEWTARVRSRTTAGPEGFGAFVVKDGNIRGVLTFEGTTYEIVPLGGTFHAIIDYSRTVVPPDGVDPPEREGSIEPEILDDDRDAAALREVVELDVFVAYSRAAARRISDISHHAKTAISVSNKSYAESKIRTKLKLVGTHAFDEDEAADFKVNRNWIRDRGDGRYDDIHALRASARADVVVLMIVNRTLAGWAGTRVSKSNAFTAVSEQFASGHFSMAHEIGHLIGTRHANGNIVPNHNWASVMKHTKNAACVNGNCSSGACYCRRDGLWTDPTARHPKYGFLLGANTTQNSVGVINKSNGAKRVSNFFP